MSSKNDNLGFVADDDDVGFTPDDVGFTPDTSDAPDAPDAPQAPTPQAIGDAIKHGLSRWIPIRALQALDRVPSGIPGRSVADVVTLGSPAAYLLHQGVRHLSNNSPPKEPTTTAEKVASFITEMADPTSFAFAGPGLKLATKIINPARAAQAERYIQMARAGKALGALTNESVDRGGRLIADRVKARALELVAERAKVAAIQAGVEGASGAFLRSTFDQLEDSGNFSVGRLAASTALGAGAGAAGGAALSRLLNRGAARKAAAAFEEAALPDAAEQAARGLPRMKERAQAELARQKGEAQLKELRAQIASGKTRMAPEELEGLRATAHQLAAKLERTERALQVIGNAQNEALFQAEHKALKGLDALINETYLQGGKTEQIAQRLIERRALLAQDINLRGKDVNFEALWRDPVAYMQTIKEIEVLDKHLDRLAKAGIKEAREATIEGVGQLQRPLTQAEKELREQVRALSSQIHKVSEQLESGLRDLTPDEIARLSRQYVIQERAFSEAPRFASREAMVPASRRGVPDSPWDAKQDLETAYERIATKIDDQIARLRQAGRADAADALEAKKEHAIAFYVHHVAGPAKPEARTQINSFFDRLLNAKERFSKLDAKHKDLRVTELFYDSYEGEAFYGNIFNRFAIPYQDAVDRLNKINPDLVKNGALYLENLLTDPVSGRVYWNPQAALPRPSDEALAALTKIRALYNQAVKESGTYGRAIEFRDAYVPHLSRRPSAQGGLDTTKKVTDKTFLHHQRERLDPQRHNLDLRDIGNYYFRNYAQWAAFNRVVPKLQRELVKLSAKGMYEEAEALVKQLMPVMGLKNRAELGRLVADARLAGLTPLVQSMAREAGQAPTFADDVIKFMHRQFYNATVFTNPFTVFSQFGQPEFVGGAEIGYRWIARGRAAASREAADAYNRWSHRLLSPELQKHLGSGTDLGEIHNKWVQRLDAVFNLPAAPGKRLFQKGEELNRKVVFRGAYDQFVAHVGREPASLQAVMEGMLEGEKRMVVRALNEHGLRAAAEVYAGIRSIRANFMFGKTDAPEFFREGLGRFVPFTTWSRNNFARLWGDLETKSYAAAVRRVAGPMMVALLISDLTGTDAMTMLTRLSPAVSAPEVLSVTALPELGEPVNAFRRGGPSAALKTLLKRTSVGRAAGLVSDVGTQVERGNPEQALRKLFNAPRVPESQQGAAGALRAFKKERRQLADIFDGDRN